MCAERATLYLLDMSSYLFRAYYAISRMTNEQGQSTNALYGAIRSVSKLIEGRQPHYMCAIFDGHNNKASRQSIYADYKGHRTEIPADLPEQIELAQEWCAAVGLPLLSMPGVEADDVMGSIARWAAQHDFEVRLCSSDKDLCQLVDTNIHILNPSKEYAEIDSASVLALHGVWPHQMVDYLAIVGDSADNIPGVRGLGPKAAAELLKAHGDLERVLAAAVDIPGRRGELLQAQRDMALLSYKLALIDTHLDVPKERSFYQCMRADHEQLVQFYRRMGFDSLIKALEKVQQDTQEQPVVVQVPEVRIADSVEKLCKLLKELENAEELCIDTETTSTNPYDATLVGIGIGAEGIAPLYIPCNHVLDWQTIKSYLDPLLAHKKIYGHNLKYDLHVLYRHGIAIPAVCFDTILASYLLFAHAHRHSLDHLTLQLFGYQKIAIEELIGKGRGQRTMQEVPIDQVARYCAEDVWCTQLLRKRLQQELEQRQLLALLEELELPLLLVLWRMEEIGIFVDAEQLEAVGRELLLQQEQLATAIFELCGSRFNLNSPKQLAQVLFVDMQLKGPRKGGAALSSTNAAVLESMLDQSPVIEMIMEYRQLHKLRSTYTEALPLAIDPRDSRVHTTFNQSMTATGRLSSMNPNLQNIPIRTAEGRRIRRAFRPQQEGWWMLSADYSQIELRLLAHMSQDPNLVAAFRRGDDIHRVTASLIHGIDPADVTKEQRQAAKAVNFGILYGQQATGLSRLLKIEVAQAKAFIAAYFERFPSVQQFLQRCREQADRDGCSTTLTGRQRLLPELASSNHQIRSAAERLAINSPIQGTAADIIKLAMLRCDSLIRDNRLRSRMILQIHDELLFEGPKEELSELKSLVKSAMENVMNLSIPLIVDIEIGQNWQEC